MRGRRPSETWQLSKADFDNVNLVVYVLDNQADDSREMTMNVATAGRLARRGHAPLRRGQRDQAALRRGGHYRNTGSAGPWLPRDLVDLPQAPPAAGRQPPCLAVDLRGFGDSDNRPGAYDSKTSAEDLHLLIEDSMSARSTSPGRTSAGRPSSALRPRIRRMSSASPPSRWACPGSASKQLADITHGGVWHIGVLAAPGIPEMLLAGREQEFLGQFAFPAMSATPELSPTPTSTSSSAPTPAPTAGAERSASTGRCCKRDPKSRPWPRRAVCPCPFSRSAQGEARSRRHHVPSRVGRNHVGIA